MLQQISKEEYISEKYVYGVSLRKIKLLEIKESDIKELKNKLQVKIDNLKQDIRSENLIIGNRKNILKSISFFKFSEKKSEKENILDMENKVYSLNKTRDTFKYYLQYLNNNITIIGKNYLYKSYKINKFSYEIDTVNLTSGNIYSSAPPYELPKDIKVSEKEYYKVSIIIKGVDVSDYNYYFKTEKEALQFVKNSFKVSYLDEELLKKIK